MKEVTVQYLKELKENDKDYLLIDVREQFEFDLSNLNGTHIPMGEIQERLGEVEDKKEAEVIIMCRSGARSARVTQFLEAEGFTNVSNLKGGITAWSREIDTTMPVA